MVNIACYVALAGSLAALLGGRITSCGCRSKPHLCSLDDYRVDVQCVVERQLRLFNLLTIALAARASTLRCMRDHADRLLSHLPQREQHTRPCGPFSRGLAMAAALILVPLNGFQLLDLVPRSEQFAAREAAASNEASIVRSAMVWLSQTRQTIRSTVGGFALSMDMVYSMR